MFINTFLKTPNRHSNSFINVRNLDYSKLKDLANSLPKKLVSLITHQDISGEQPFVFWVHLVSIYVEKCAQRTCSELGRTPQGFGLMIYKITAEPVVIIFILDLLDQEGSRIFLGQRFTISIQFP